MEIQVGLQRRSEAEEL